VNRMLTLLACSGIVWPVPVAGPAPSAISCPVTIAGPRAAPSRPGTGQPVMQLAAAAMVRLARRAGP